MNSISIISDFIALSPLKDKTIGAELKGFLSQAGFTLLEILIAIFIFSVIMTTVYTSYTGALSNINATEETTDNYHKARVTFERIIEDLESAFIPRDSTDPISGESVFKLPGFIGEDIELNGRDRDSIRFSSEAHISFESYEGPVRAAIAYYVEESNKDESLILLRSDISEFSKQSEGEQGYILCDNLHSINFTYKDSSGEEYDYWDSTNKTFNKGRMPAMVSITLEFQHAGKSKYYDRFTTSVALSQAKGNHYENS